MITGARGQLGRDLLDAYAGHDVVALGHEDLDVADGAAVERAMAEAGPNLVVHAAAWTDVDGCERDPDRAHAVNALGTWWLARACEASGAAMVMISTDYVFGADGGSGNRAYDEFAPIAPVNEYGRSKAAGEQLLRSTLREHYVVRTSWVCGARGANFVRTMLRVGSERGEARVVDDQMASPTFTRDLSAAIVELAATGRFGTYHRTNTGVCSWYDLAAETFRRSGLDVELSRMSSDELDRPAARPAFSALSNRHAELSGLTSLPTWQDGLGALLAELEDEETA